ncbi:hypothetical protein MYU51_001673 [Penicillium brevicompactum]|uniref:uncharacterized protein n=1 Tax=Penicillium brevicompactum TaxID=5074 RepID=UPI00253F74B1|nr:uncharacterized protein N7506_009892 [Penicillium brevicompactum]KAJ5326790.1 hypothetical protein N7506_009892 [Penicillium brevicompactum]
MEPATSQSQVKATCDNVELDIIPNDLKDEYEICVTPVKREEAGGCASPNDPFSTDAHADDNPHMWTSTRSIPHEHYQEPVLFSTILNMIRYSGKPNHPRIMRRLSKLEFARQAIWSDQVASRIVGERISAREREASANWLFPPESDTPEFLRHLMDDVWGESPRRAAIYDALHYWNNVDYLRERIENLEDRQTTEAKGYRGLIEHFGSPPTIRD